MICHKTKKTIYVFYATYVDSSMVFCVYDFSIDCIRGLYYRSIACFEYCDFYEIWIPKGKSWFYYPTDSMRFGFPRGSPGFIIRLTAYVCMCAPRHLVEVWARLVVAISGTS